MGQHSSSWVWGFVFFPFLWIKHYCYVLRGETLQTEWGAIFSPRWRLQVKHQCIWALSHDQASNSASYSAFVQTTNAVVRSSFEKGLSLINEHTDHISVWQKCLPGLRKVLLKAWRLPVGLLRYKTAPRPGSSAAHNGNGVLCTWRMRGGVLRGSTYMPSVNSY